MLVQVKNQSIVPFRYRKSMKYMYVWVKYDVL